jgi:hypothetical protein
VAMTYDPWHLPERQAQILDALTTLVQRGQLDGRHVHEVETLYARGRVFEAERVAGLAIWLAMSPPQHLLQALQERLGVLVQAWHRLSATLVTMDQWELWRPYADTCEEFQRDALQVSQTFYTRLVHLVDGEHHPNPLTLHDRGRAVRHVLTRFTARDPTARAPVCTPLGLATHSTLTLDTVTTQAQQIIDELLWLGHTLQAIRSWELWTEQAPSYAVFLDDVLGLGVSLAFGLDGLASAWDSRQPSHPALATLETAVQIVMGHTATTTPLQKGASS